MVYDSESTSEGAHEFAGLTFSVGTNNVVKAELYTNKNVADDRSMNKIVVVSPQSGEPYATAPNTRSTPSANEIITYDFLQQYVEANGGGSGIADFNQVFNDTANSDDAVTLPSGGSWLVHTLVNYGSYYELGAEIRAGGYRYNRPIYRTCIAAVRIA